MWHRNSIDQRDSSVKSRVIVERAPIWGTWKMAPSGSCFRGMCYRHFVGSAMGCQTASSMWLSTLSEGEGEGDGSYGLLSPQKATVVQKSA